MRIPQAANGSGTKRFGSRPRKAIEISMTPMIDVIFLLLVFFLATSSFQPIEYLLPSDLSQVKEAAGAAAEQVEPTEEQLQQIVIKLQERAVGQPPQVSLNGGQPVEFEEVRARLETLATLGQSVPVIIDPAAGVEAKYVVSVYDWARNSGLSRVYLAIRPR